MRAGHGSWWRRRSHPPKKSSLRTLHDFFGDPPYPFGKRRRRSHNRGEEGPKKSYWRVGGRSAAEGRHRSWAWVKEPAEEAFESGQDGPRVTRPDVPPAFPRRSLGPY